MPERVDWHTYFMNIARQVSSRSTCPRKHVGAAIALAVFVALFDALWNFGFWYAEPIAGLELFGHNLIITPSFALSIFAERAGDCRRRVKRASSHRRTSPPPAPISLSRQCGPRQRRERKAQRERDADPAQLGADLLRTARLRAAGLA